MTSDVDVAVGQAWSTPWGIYGVERITRSRVIGGDWVILRGGRAVRLEWLVKHCRLIPT